MKINAKRVDENAEKTGVRKDAIEMENQWRSPFSRRPVSAHCRTPADINTAILVTVRAGAAGYFNVAQHRTALNEKAGWIVDFDHFRRLCIGDMRQAFDENRRDGKRTVHNRRRTWRTLFGYFAAHAGIQRAVQIVALDREGNYACALTDKEDEQTDGWDAFIRLGRRFGITAVQLEALRRSSQTGQARGAHAAGLDR